MVLVLGERSVREDVSDTDLPQLPREDFEVFNEHFTPGRIPRRISAWPRSPDKHRLPEIREGNLVIAGRKEAILIEEGNRCHVYRSATHDTLDHLDTYVKVTYHGMKWCPVCSAPLSEMSIGSGCGGLNREYQPGGFMAVLNRNIVRR